MASAIRSTLTKVIQVTSGNFFEAFDLLVFGTFSKVIADNFFPQENEQERLMLAFSTFASGYAMRFLGAITLGPYSDHVGRRKGLLLSFAIMAIGTAIIAVAPTYRMIGIAAPILLVGGRLIQGFSAGSETGSLTAYLLEIAPANRNALYVSWNASSFLFATLVATILGFVLQGTLAADALEAWGWRVPFLVGCCIIPLIYAMRRTLPESEAFREQRRHLSTRSILVAVVHNWRIALAGMMLTALTSCMFYFIFVFMPVFAKESLRLSVSASFYPAILTIIYSIVMVTVFSVISDKVGRFPLILLSTVLIVLTAYPTLRFLTGQPSYQRLILAQLWFATLYAAHSSSSFVSLSEAVPARIRATGYGVTTTLGLAIFGGGTPLAATWLARATGNRSAPGFWLMGIAIGSLVAAYLLLVKRIALRGVEMSSIDGTPAPALAVGGKRHD